MLNKWFGSPKDEGSKRRRVHRKMGKGDSQGGAVIPSLAGCLGP